MSSELAWALERIRQTEVSTDPYPHLVVDSFLPWEYWQRLMQSWPEEMSCHESVPGKVKQRDLIADPGVKRSCDGRWRDLIEHEEWQQFRRDFMVAVDLTNALIHKFLDDIEATALRDGDQSYTVGRCAYDYKGAGLGPHTDRIDKVFSLVLYMARGDETDEERKAMGTQLLRPKDPKMETTDQHYTWDDFDVVKTVEYTPNRLICWPVVPSSFHAYEQTVEGPRKSIKMFIQKVLPLDQVWGRIAETKKHAEDWRGGKE